MLFFFAALNGDVPQNPQLSFIADTLLAADGTYDADPDLATLTFRSFRRVKTSKRRTKPHQRSMQHIATSTAE